MDTLIFKHVRGAPWYLGAALTAAVAGVAWGGLHRSLWFDEAWLANVARSSSWMDMFRGGTWFQTSPPLFLAISHIAVTLFGLSTATFRAIPLLFAVITGLVFYATVRRISPAFAPAATAALLYYRISVEYFLSFKQYAGEIAAVTVVLWAAVRYLEVAMPEAASSEEATSGSSSRARFAILCACLIGLEPLAYPLAFVAPAVVVAVFLASLPGKGRLGKRLLEKRGQTNLSTASRQQGVDGKRGQTTLSSASSQQGVNRLPSGTELSVPLFPLFRASILAAGSGTMLAVLYYWFIRPNTSPALWTYWSQSFSATYSPGMWLAVGALAAATVWGFWRRDAILLLCLLPCVFLLAAEQMHWYPISSRTRLFVRPCMVLGAARVVDQCVDQVMDKWFPRAQSRGWVAIAGAMAALIGAIVTLHAGAGPPAEDYATATAYLREHIAPGDLLIIHADARDGLLLYFDMQDWHPEDHGATVRWGSTGWPCCARLHPTAPGQSTEAAVRADLNRVVPTDYRGRVWLVYTTRQLHWDYTGLDEGAAWRKIIQERGCARSSYQDMNNVVALAADCGGR